MATKRNKKYKPRQVIQNPMQFICGGFKKIDDEHKQVLNIKNSEAMLKIVNGTADKPDFDLLIGASNMALVLCEIHDHNNAHDDLIKARDALHSLGKRYLELDRFVLKGDEMQAINHMLEIHDEQLNVMRVVDVERGYAEIQRRLRHHIGTKTIVERVAA